MQETQTNGLTQELFEQLFHRCERKLCAVAYAFVRDRDTARDIVNDSFTTVWNRRASLEPVNLEAYLFQVVRNRSLEYRRSRRLERAVYEKILMKERGVMDYYTRTIECCAPNELFRSEIMDICRRQLAQMPELRRQIFTAHKFGGQSYKEIADSKGITLKKVDRELQTAMSKLRLSLKDYLLIFVMLFFRI